jgi:hypothetical protein
MFHPPQAAIGLALLPMAWAAEERARAERGGLSGARERDADLARYFPPGWQRDTVPRWPVAVPSRSVAREGVAREGASGEAVATEGAAAEGQRAAVRWQSSRLFWRSAVRWVKGLVMGYSRG